MSYDETPDTTAGWWTRHGSRIASTVVTFSVLAVTVVVMRGAMASADGEAAPAPASPTRVLVVGDSMMNQAAAVLERRHPDVDLRNEAVDGSGLLTPEVADWPRRVDRLVDSTDFDVIVVLFVGNYTRSDYWVTEEGDTVTDKTSDAFFDAWAGRARQVAHSATASGADVVWVLPPPMGVARNQEVVDGLRQVYRSVGDAYPGIQLVDSFDVLATDDGGVRRFGSDPLGGHAALRTPDGLHLTQTGAVQLADMLSQAIFDRTAD